MLTDAALDAIRERLRALDQTPWTIEPRNACFAGLKGDALHTAMREYADDEFLGFHLVGPRMPGRGEFVASDALFLVHARETVLVLLGEIDELRKKLGEG